MTPSPQPSKSPSDGLTIRNPVFDPCADALKPLVGVAVVLYNYRGIAVDEAATDKFGYYEFSGLPIGRYFVRVEYEECPSHLPSFEPNISSFPTKEPIETPSTTRSSSYPSYSPSRLSSTSVMPTKKPTPLSTEPPTASPVGGMTIRRPAFDPCTDNALPLVGAIVTLYDPFGKVVTRTLTDSEGIYTFTGLPMGRYRTEVDFPACDIRRELSSNEQFSTASLPSDNLVKFYSRGDVCDVSFGGLETTSTADITHFDTLDECCANVFWYDMDGCFLRSRVAFQFEFCLDISGLDSYSNCPIQVIESIESAMQKGLGNNSELTLLNFGSTILTNVDGETKCFGPILDQDSTPNQLRGFAGSSGNSLKICGVVVTKAECKEELCLREAFDNVVVPFQSYFYNRAFSSVLHSISDDMLHPLHAVVSSFMARKLLLPSTVTSSNSRKDGAISQKKAAATVHSTFTETPRFYPTYITNELCHSKTSFDSWEESYGTLRECCEVFFSFDFEACCSSLDMGGC